MTNTIDKIVLNIGKTSNNVSVISYTSTFHQANKILELVDRKRKMINLKVATEEVLSKMDSSEKRILTLCYFDGVTSEMIAQLLGVSLRTFFRKKEYALKIFSGIMQELGYDEEFFQSEYSTEKWFTAIYDDCISKVVETSDSLDKFLVKRVFNEVSKIDIRCNSYV